MLNSSCCIYQIVTDRFYNGDCSINAEGHLFSPDGSNLRKYLGGDWEGIIRTIEEGYFTELGVGAILISQPVENVATSLPDEFGTTSYHGYWPKDFLKPNPYFGTIDKFDELIRVAHANHIKVLIDFTPNHTSPALETVVDYMENGVLYHDGEKLASYTGDTDHVFLHNGGTDFLSYENSVYRNLYDLASFNHLNPLVDRVLREGIAYWVNRGIDGIRIDAAKHVPPGWLKSLTGYIQSIKPVFIFGEWFLLEQESPADNGDFANRSGMSLLNFPLCHAVRQVLNGDKPLQYLAAMWEAVDCHYTWTDDQVLFIDNHDMSRFTVNDPRLTDLALVLLLTSKGTPMIYYGTEQYMTGERDPDNRSMMSSFDRTTPAYRIIARLSRLRRRNTAAAFGKVRVLYCEGEVIVYEKQQSSDILLVMINLNEASVDSIAISTALPEGVYRSELADVWPSFSLQVDGSGMAIHALPPKSASVYAIRSRMRDAELFSFYPRMTASGSTLHIYGEGLGEAAGHVVVGGKGAKILSWSSNTVTVEVPALAAGYHAILVATAEGEDCSMPASLEVLTDVPVTVRFVVMNARTNYGEDLFLSGNLFELGEWQPDRSTGPFFNNIMYTYPTWYYDISLPVGKEIQFKFFRRDRSGRVIWQEGDIHSFTAPITGTSEVIVQW